MPKTVPTAPLLDAGAGSDKRIYVDANGQYVLQVQHRRCWKSTKVIPLKMLWKTKQWSLDAFKPKPVTDAGVGSDMFRAYLQRPNMQVDVKTGLLSITSAPDDPERIKAGVETDYKSTAVRRHLPQTTSPVTAHALPSRVAPASDVSEGRLTAIDMHHLTRYSSPNRVRSRDRSTSEVSRWYAATLYTLANAGPCGRQLAKLASNSVSA